MTEQTLLFGPTKSLAGIVTLAEDGVDQRRVGVILLNAGLIHRVGPNRIYVDLARLLARQGVNTLRFDLSGIGDSDRADSDLSLLERRISETMAAMDAMTRTCGCEQFVLGGLCSGADLSFAASVSDPRVVGMALIEPFGYRSTGYFVRHYWSRLFRLQSWRNFVTGNHTFWKRLRGGGQPSSMVNDKEKVPSPARVEEAFQSLLVRGVQCLVVYAGGAFNHPRQFKELFPKIADHDNIKLQFFDRADHVFVIREYQSRLLNVIGEWMAEREFPDPPTAPES